jgi:hypothetical protein
MGTARNFQPGDRVRVKYCDSDRTGVIQSWDSARQQGVVVISLFGRQLAQPFTDKELGVADDNSGELIVKFKTPSAKEGLPQGDCIKVGKMS